MLGRRATAVFVQYGSGGFAGRTVHVPRQNLKHANVPKSNGAHLSGCPLHSDTSVRVRATSCARKQQWVTWICSMQGENVTNLPPSFSASFAKTQHSLRRRYAHTRTARSGGGGAKCTKVLAGTKKSHLLSAAGGQSRWRKRPRKSTSHTATAPAHAASENGGRTHSQLHATSGGSHVPLKFRASKLTSVLVKLERVNMSSRCHATYQAVRHAATASA